jgi:hypothetical protein
MFRNSLPLLFLALFAACGGSGQPLDADFGGGTIETTVGPGGATIAGLGGTALGGFSLEIPAGALQRLVRLKIKVGTDIDLPGSVAAAVPISIEATPDPGALTIAAKLTMAFDLPQGRLAADLFVAGRQSTPSLAGGRGTRIRPGLAAELGSYDQRLRIFRADVGSLSDLQVRRATDPRLVDDANALVTLALNSLDRLTDESIAKADRQLAAALTADPFFPAARVLRAVTRVLVVGNDRTETGPGLSSIGEAVTRAGLDLRSRSLLRRIVDDVWPVRATPGRDVPTPGAVLEMLQTRLRPALEAGLVDLAFVPPQNQLVLRLPGPIGGLAGKREIDAADFFFLRAGFAFSLYLLDALEDLDLTVDVKYLVSSASSLDDLADLLVRFPEFARLRARPAERTVDHLVEAMFAMREAIKLLNAETDAQNDDLIVFSSSFDAGKRDRWQGNFAGLLGSLLGGDAHPLVRAGEKALPIDLVALRTGLDVRGLLPTIAKYEPLAGTGADPTFGGLFPGLTQDGAARLFHLVNRFALAQIAITIDGDTRDWPAAAEALRPVDASGDSGEVRDLDLARVFLGLTGDDLVCRLSLASGSFRYDANRTAVWGFDLRPQRERPAQGGPSIQVLVEMTASGPRLTVRRDGKLIAVDHSVAVSKGELELALDRFDLFEPDEPTRDRVLRVFSAGAESKGAKRGGDQTRRILLRL